MRLTQLQYFVRTASLGSINAAAKDMNVTQPAISTAIHNLEEELGTPLFNRYSKRMELTDAGMVFFRKVNDILKELDDAVNEIHGYVPDTDILRLGIPPMIGTMYMSMILKGFIPQHPNVQLKVHEANTKELSEMLQNHELDLALMIGESPYSMGFERKTVLNTRYSFYVGKASPLVQCAEVSLDELAKEPLMLFDTGLFLNSYITNAFVKAGTQRPRVVFASSQINSIKTYVSQSLGGTFLIRECVKEDDGLVEVPTVITPDISIVATWPKGIAASTASKALCRFLKACYE